MQYLYIIKRFLSKLFKNIFKLTYFIKNIFKIILMGIAIYLFFKMF